MKILSNKTLTTFSLMVMIFFISLNAFSSPSLSDYSGDISSTSKSEQSESFIPWYKNVESQFGGHFKFRGSVSWPDNESIFKLVDTDSNLDGNTELRLKNKLFFEEWGYFETHYEAITSGGNTRRKINKVKQINPNLFRAGLFFGRPVEDDRRFMDLTKSIDDDDDDESFIIYHRLDRFSLTLFPKDSTIVIGRQAVTWGNGLLFNPMDLFNPFSPTDIERDYKLGDDMLSAQFSVKNIGNCQILYVPRRDPLDGNVKWNQSSLAGKLHFAKGTTEFDLMLAKHYDDPVLGIGSTGYLGDTAWRLDGIWSFLRNNENKNGFLTLVANMDYSWVLWEKNFYGFLEFYYNSLGKDDYNKAINDEDIVERIERGELFTLGKLYLSTHIRVEIHPLFNIFITVINNLADPSGTIQPRAVWDAAEDVQVTFGGNVLYGEENTEFGGFRLAGTDILIKAPENVFLWITYFF